MPPSRLPSNWLFISSHVCSCSFIALGINKHGLDICHLFGTRPGVGDLNTKKDHDLSLEAGTD